MSIASDKLERWVEYLGIDLYLPILCEGPKDCPEVAEHFSAANVYADMVCSRKGIVRIPHQFPSLQAIDPTRCLDKGLTRFCCYNTSFKHEVKSHVNIVSGLQENCEHDFPAPVAEEDRIWQQKGLLVAGLEQKRQLHEGEILLAKHTCQSNVYFLVPLAFPLIRFFVSPYLFKKRQRLSLSKIETIH